MSSTDRAPAQQTPAWKRLGLKLKQPSAASEPSSGFGHPGSFGSSTTHLQSATKRKFDAPPPANSSQVAKRPRPYETTGDRNGQLKRQKSVTFADNTSSNKGTPQKTPKSKGPAKKQTPADPVDLKPALEYLSLWKTARDSWKFKKNYQSKLIDHVFDDTDGIPASHIEIFYDYISDLNGFVRTRMKEMAEEVKNQDQSDGAKAFPEGTKDLEAKQQQYETVLARYLQPAGTKRKGFTEVDYLSDSDDDQVIIQRLVKRMRAELVIEELSDSEATEVSTTSSVPAIETKATPAVQVVKPSEATGRRRRKLRTNVDSDSSSSDSSSDSDSGDDSDTSSSGSSSDEEATPGQYRRAGDDTSSSSSSSSDDEDSSDSDSD